ncbi:DUF1652 domain-containing protein [Pseudomonas typographi]|uniref:DUF1652 domain-containing protein n=1 Tax=Pseudomonas typographi TaxID=2715964 RepID=UPI001685B8E6|nr:DUF1652 domain-containing protein [Pseudomonas typographi]MBD1590044.1 DUF1652 domain-containing protein [Pseudomonas typographi]
MLSTLELRNIIESSFLPQRCQCTQGRDHSLTVKIFGRGSDHVDLTVTGIDSRGLNSSRAISSLIMGLRHDLAKHHHQTRPKVRPRAHASL